MSVFNGPIRNMDGFKDMVEAADNGFCPLCKKPIIMKEFRDALSQREFKISGMCQKCQDSIFGPEPEE